MRFCSEYGTPSVRPSSRVGGESSPNSMDASAPATAAFSSTERSSQSGGVSAVRAESSSRMPRAADEPTRRSSMNSRSALDRRSAAVTAPSCAARRLTVEAKRFSAAQSLTRRR
eukprot:5004884-Prymnesium_polylepis.2